MSLFYEASTGVLLAAFTLAALTIARFGVKLTGDAQEVASRTGVGQALVGTLLLGAVTSLPGLVTTILAAYRGNAELAVSNAFGGIAAQTVFLVLADFVHRSANLEHASASLTNLVQSVVLILLLGIPLLAALGPDVSVFGVHPLSFALPVLFFGGIHLARTSEGEMPWRAAVTAQTMNEEEPRDSKLSNTQLTYRVLGAVVAVTAAGAVIALTGELLAVRFGLSQGVAGTYITAIPTSLPELVTVLAAVRAGALKLAVADIIGGNCFDVLFAFAGDLAYRDGSIYHSVGHAQLIVIAVAILQTASLSVGLLRREPHGPANVGLESIGILFFYVLGAVFLFVGG